MEVKVGYHNGQDFLDDLWKSLDRLWAATSQAKRDFEGLLAVLYGKRPRTGPPPLCVDGHEYHRRQQARKRRKRGRR